MDKKTIKLAPVHNIIDVIRSNDPFILERWKAQNFTYVNNILSFDVKGLKFKGDVIITLNAVNKTYSISFNIMKNGRKNVVDKKSGVKKEDIVDLLNTYIMGD